ncbi:hypothetical protein ZIOFF_024310 [Zingiber officinale]|uniref:eIF-4F 25 kDa subunit n=1 Tax=Zingiber officinale TaxID=94328 RepID=A0A8J5GY32_ZINOF|nr:hypothetical protein ZIOFF_024310 [Zingiber officinale]
MMAVDNGIPTTIEKANGEGGELEEGEIVGNSAMGEAEPRQGAEGEDEDGDAGEQDDCGSQRKQVEIHPLEHSWTFWFDNHVGKSKQVAWGSTIRAVYTFSTAEDFWGKGKAIVYVTNHWMGMESRCGGGCNHCEDRAQGQEWVGSALRGRRKDKGSIMPEKRRGRNTSGRSEPACVYMMREDKAKGN